MKGCKCLSRRMRRLGVCLLAAILLPAVWAGCGIPTPFLVQGADSALNDVPTLTILEPVNNLTRGQGEPILIRWTDTDRDNNARISFSLVNTETGQSVLLVSGLEENDLTGPDSFQARTALVPQGTYNLLGVIDDSVNGPVNVFAMDENNPNQRIEIRIVGPGQGNVTVPPRAVVVEPAFNRSVTQDDILRVVVWPTDIEPNNDDNPDNDIPFDPDSELNVYVVLDLDTDPTNDNVLNPKDDEIILLRQDQIAEGASQAVEYEIEIDLEDVPPRANGEPYYVRVTLDDQNNPPVHRYANGTINVVRLAAGLVDLSKIGTTLSGMRIYGFNPGANVGSSISTVSDFDNDGVDDFVVVGQFGNPRNLGRIGEAYLVYGLQDQARFGGAIAANSTGDTISGAIFEAPPIRGASETDLPPRTDGITHVSWVPDLSGDGRPEILFGMPHVHGAAETQDWDPGDEAVTDQDADIQVSLQIRRGQVQLTDDIVGTVITNRTYNGVFDVTISSSNPNTDPQTPGSLGWGDNGPGDRSFALIKFTDLLEEIPDQLDLIDITSVDANIRVRVFDLGDDATAFQSLSDFDETTNFNTYSAMGGLPVEDTDYAVDLGNVGANAAQLVEIDVSELIRQLIDRSLPAEVNDEIRIILVPNGANGVSLRSSEYNSILADRPTLTINYSRADVIGQLGCYPDALVNNSSDDAVIEGRLYQGGFGLMFDSENRDNAGAPADPASRLENTSVALELVGQQRDYPLDRVGLNRLFPLIRQLADGTNADVAGEDTGAALRINGARFIAGGYDEVDSSLLNQGAREGLWGETINALADINNDTRPELILSAPTNERYMEDLRNTYGDASTHIASTPDVFQGSIAVIAGDSFNATRWRNQPSGASTLPRLSGNGTCLRPQAARSLGDADFPALPADTFAVFAEDIDDYLGDGQSAGDINLDGLADLLMGAPRNDRTSTMIDTGATYIIYSRTVFGDIDLGNLDDPFLRPPTIRIFGVKPGDRIGTKQAAGLDVNGDRIDDVFFSSPTADFGNVARAECGEDFNNDGLVNAEDFSDADFDNCMERTGDYVFSDDACKVFDYDFDFDLDDDDRGVLECLREGRADCCDNLVENGFVGVVFGGVFLDGDRTINQLATSELPGAVFFGAAAGHRAGLDVSSAGDFNQDGFGDLLIVAPGETRRDENGRERLGVVYLIFGGQHLTNTIWNLSQVGSQDLPGIVFLSPYVSGQPNEAAPTRAALIGDINADGFGDIAVGNPRADFIDLSFPQGPNAPGTDAGVGRRRDAGDAYIIYGNNFGSNRGL